MKSPEDGASVVHQGERIPLKKSVFWKVAGILVGVQVATGLLAVALSVWFSYDRSLDLAENSLRLRLDALAEEVEQRSSSLDEGLAQLSSPLLRDLAFRFPDPILLLDPAGRPIQTILPDSAEFNGQVSSTGGVLPEGLGNALSEGQIVIRQGEQSEGGGWGLTPVYDPAGFLVGGLLVQPLTASFSRELAGTREAILRAVWVVLALAGLIALLLGAFFTVRLMRPLRRMTRQVESIGAGNYSTRLVPGQDDEFGRLAGAINQMAGAVEQSVETLRATDRLRRELIANIGHDLRTPLAATMGYLEEARRYMEEQAPAKAEQALKTAEAQGRYLKRLIDDLFELSVLDSAAAPLRLEPIPLAELLHDAIRRHRAAYQEAGITLNVELGALPIIEGDGVRLLRLLDNLLVNARHHTAEGGRVLLRAAQDQGQVVVEVKDTGEGMSAEVLAHVFERHYRGKGARTRQAIGTGLGLPISHAIARAHQGDLTAQSTPGQGSTFTLVLPVERSK